MSEQTNEECPGNRWMSTTEAREAKKQGSRLDKMASERVVTWIFVLLKTGGWF